jgi:carboxyl-terminal processing protease
LDIFNSTYKELELFYVDTIKPESTIKYGIDAMLGQLDPYTTYIPESELEKLKFMTTGEYAGIGCVIGKNDEGIYITDVYEGMPAYKNGLKVGDIISVMLIEILPDNKYGLSHKVLINKDNL